VHSCCSLIFGCVLHSATFHKCYVYSPSLLQCCCLRIRTGIQPIKNRYWSITVLSGHLTTQVAFTSLRTLKDVLLSDYLVVFGIVKWETGDFFHFYY